ncbi:MAG: DUF2148 domain-containing protein [Candidatus Omnitrophica bacterium]|nr:DUF2148 domain-containing protein [Candidatus Omnitrophota bacterium]
MDSTHFEAQALEHVAGLMCVAARTAPKAKGVDNICTLVLSPGPDRQRLLSRMREIARTRDKPGFRRDADNAERAALIVIIGTKTGSLGLTVCGMCGYADCQSCGTAGALCAYNPLDMGIAIGSAVNIAAAHHVDNRIMYSIGKTALDLNLFGEVPVKIAMGIPISATGKNIFFDRG